MSTLLHRLPADDDQWQPTVEEITDELEAIWIRQVVTTWVGIMVVLAGLLILKLVI